MKKLQILGTGCQKCKKLMENVQIAAKELDMEVEFEKIEQLDKIMEFGVMMTPALAIDGEVKAAGKVLNVEEIKKILN
ncbi:MAG: thioredoxin family protein [Candidatus Muiribacterium halophilum]|uniref:Thioredoxin family protein n=1 Tax=Muiribacterium halophilum TaxID=2053465 RepID=A0A2N5ZMC4_MUIH1|nr:MAG: thioredoxin family protein [Candidatus Muirbacterium halophilum]